MIDKIQDIIPPKIKINAKLSVRVEFRWNYEILLGVVVSSPKY